MRKVLCAIALAIPVVVFTQAPADSVSPRAKQLHDRAIVVDSHDDTTQRLLFDKTFDIGTRHTNGNIDIPRMREGGLDALFFSIWVPSDVTGPTAVKRALDQIDAVREAVRSASQRSDAGDDRRRRAQGGRRSQDRRADGHGRRPHDRRRSAAAARTTRRSASAT